MVVGDGGVGVGDGGACIQVAPQRIVDKIYFWELSVYLSGAFSAPLWEQTLS